MSIKRKAVNATKWAFIQQFGIVGLNFIVTLILTRILEPSDYGLLGLISIFIGLGNVFVSSGMTQSIIRTINPTEKDYSSVFILNVLISVIVYVILYISSYQIAIFFNQPKLEILVKVYSVSIIIQSFGVVQIAKLTKEMNFKKQSKIQIPSLIIAGITGIIMAYTGWGVWALVYMSLLQVFLNSLQYWLYSELNFTFKYDIEIIKKHFRFGYKLLLSGLLDQLFINIYTVVMGKFFSIQQLGYYNRAFSLRQMPVQNISAVINKVTYPLFAEIQNDDLKLKAVYSKVMLMVLFVVTPILLILNVVAEPLFRFLFTEKWLPAVFYFKLLCYGGILYPLQIYNLNVLTVKGRSDLFLKLEVIKKVITVIGLCITVPMGIEAILYFQVFFSCLAYFINSMYSGRFINFPVWEQLRLVFPVFLLNAVVFIICLFIDYFVIVPIGMNDLFRILILSSIFGILYLSAAFHFKYSSLIELIQIIKKKK